MSIKVLVVDDHVELNEALSLLINGQEDLQVVGKAYNGLDAIEFTGKLRPDVVVMNISLPGLDGIECTKQIMDRYPKTKVMALSTYYNIRFVKEMFKAGALGYVMKGCVSKEISKAIRSVSRGERYPVSNVPSLA